MTTLSLTYEQREALAHKYGVADPNALTADDIVTGERLFAEPVTSAIPRWRISIFSESGSRSRASTTTTCPRLGAELLPKERRRPGRSRDAAR